MAYDANFPLTFLTRVMDAAPIVTAPSTSLSDALAQATQGGNPQVSASLRPVVVAADGEWLGAIFPFDLVQAIATWDPLQDIDLADLPLHPVATLVQTEFHHIRQLLAAMQQQQTSLLLVMDESGRLVGTIWGDRLMDDLRTADLLKLQVVADVVDTQVMQIATYTPLQDIARRMAVTRANCAVVVESRSPQNSSRLSQVKRYPVGLITPTDLAQATLAGCDRRTPAAAIMQSIDLFIGLQDSLWHAQRHMTQLQVPYLVVFSASRHLIGVVHQQDISQHGNPAAWRSRIPSLGMANPAAVPQNNPHLSDPDELLCEFLPDGQITRANPAYCHYFGISPDQVYQHNVFDFLPRRDRRLLTQHLKQLTPTTPMQMSEHQVVAANGECRWQLWSDRAIFDDTGGLLRFQSVGRDVTSRHQAEDALRQREAQLRLITDSVPVMIAQVDAQQRYQFVNQRYAQWFQRQPDDILQRSLREIMPADLYDTIQPYINAVLAGRSVQFEVSMVDSQGQPHAMQVDYIPQHLPHPAGFFVLIQDISDRKRTEQALRESEERFRTVADFTEDWEYWLGPDGQFLYMSPSCHRLTGYGVSEFVQDPTLLEQLIHPEDRDLVANAQFRAKTAAVSVDFRIITRSGDICWFSQVSQPVFNDQGDWRGVRSSNRDISDRKRVEQELREQVHREQVLGAIAQHIRQSLKLDDILASITTDIRTLLAVDRVMIQRLEDDGTGLIIEESLGQTQLSMLGWMVRDPWTLDKKYLNLYRQGRVLAVEDVQAQPLKPHQQEFLDYFNIRAQLVVPLLQGDRLWGLMIVQQCHTVRHWKPGEVRLLQQLATQFSIAIQQAELHEELKQANQKLQRIAFLDGLTQVANRRRFDQYLDQEWRRLLRVDQPLSLLMCDIDFFKYYNDTHGHQEGDRCLRMVASLISQVVKRPADLVARYGGEEFAIVLPNTDQDGAIQVAKNISASIRAMDIRHAASQVASYITVSLGVATVIPSRDTFPETLIRMADMALYTAKREGRNTYRVCTQAQAVQAGILTEMDPSEELQERDLESARPEAATGETAG
jgi:diguanylate cyclase (GGDEF)-like protein/PAS domain S-box-containing protein